jgi:hypothetical protein
MLMEQEDSNSTTSGSKAVAPARPTKATSPRKVEANRRNAQHSTGPQTQEGKVKSSQNSITHGIFVKKFLNGATPETVAELDTLAAGIREHYQPVGMLEEILMQKIVVEAARYDRVLAFEHQQLTRDHAFQISRAVDCIDRYTTSTSRALFRAIEELERFQAARKAVKRPVDSSQESAPRDPKPEEEQRAPQDS